MRRPARPRTHSVSPYRRRPERVFGEIYRVRRLAILRYHSGESGNAVLRSFVEITGSSPG